MSPAGADDRPVVALSGGIGGAKLALGLYHVLAPGRLSVVANPGDDFEHLGLHVSPDLDTLMYTLAGVANPDTGWGRAGETWTFMAALERLGGETWFRLGDGDLATHVERTRRLRAGERLTTVTAALCERLGIAARLLPASDDPVRTLVDTPGATLAFQHYFVRDGCAPTVRGLRFAGAERARPGPEVVQALAAPGLRAVVVCPSNPLISIDPILAVPGIREALERTAAPVVAVSPIVGGRAVKGPTAKMMDELGLPVSAAAVAAHYGALLDGFVLDTVDGAQAAAIDVPVRAAPTLMRTLVDKRRLARVVLAMADDLAACGARPSRTSRTT